MGANSPVSRRLTRHDKRSKKANGDKMEEAKLRPLERLDRAHLCARDRMRQGAYASPEKMRPGRANSPQERRNTHKKRTFPRLSLPAKTA